MCCARRLMFALLTVLFSISAFFDPARCASGPSHLTSTFIRPSSLTSHQHLPFHPHSPPINVYPSNLARIPSTFVLFILTHLASLILHQCWPFRLASPRSVIGVGAREYTGRSNTGACIVQGSCRPETHCTGRLRLAQPPRVTLPAFLLAQARLCSVASGAGRRGAGGP